MDVRPAPSRGGQVIVVVGGGITGLATGGALARAGADFVVMEGDDRVGGVLGRRLGPTQPGSDVGSALGRHQSTKGNAAGVVG